MNPVKNMKMPITIRMILIMDQMKRKNLRILDLTRLCHTFEFLLKSRNKNGPIALAFLQESVKGALQVKSDEIFLFLILPLTEKGSAVPTAPFLD